MKLTEKAVNDFRDIWRKQFGQEITFEEAREYAEQMLTVLQVVMRPVPLGRPPPVVVKNKGPPVQAAPCDDNANRNERVCDSDVTP